MSKTKKNVYIALGSNIAPKESYLNQAIDYIDHLADVNVTAASNVYQTVPKGYTDQDDFLNMVISVETTLGSESLLEKLQQIEYDLNRVRTIKNGPRTIDLDMLMYGNEKIDTSDLKVPHPRLHERAFVLFPFSEVAPDVVVPTFGKTVKNLRDALPQEEKDDVEVKDSLENLIN